MTTVLLIVAGTAILFAWLERGVSSDRAERVRNLNERLNLAMDGWGRDQRAMFEAQRRVARLEERLRHFGHEVPQ
jgi:hypothetical protein